MQATQAPYNAPPRATAIQKLGPGGLSTYLLALSSSVLLVGLPIAWQLRRVLRAAEERPIEPADAILVLGRKLEKDCLTPVFEARLRCASAIFHQGLSPRILVAGGITGKATLSEAEAGCGWLISQGLPPGALFAEDRSQHTLENISRVRELARTEGWRSLILVSDPLHLARAQAMARGLGLETTLAPAVLAPPRRSTAG